MKLTKQSKKCSTTKYYNVYKTHYYFTNNKEEEDVDLTNPTIVNFVSLVGIVALILGAGFLVAMTMRWVKNFKTNAEARKEAKTVKQQQYWTGIIKAALKQIQTEATTTNQAGQ